MRTQSAHRPCTAAAFSIVALAAASLFSVTPAVAAEPASGSYCTSTGGVASTMRPWSGANNSPREWVAYGGSVSACTYTAEDGSQITLWNSTLTSAAPTMAALAYYAKVPLGSGSGNPSLYYCEQLKGAWMIGNGLDGGGWADSRGGRIYSMCVFADGSAIDAWGLAYHSNGTVRGIDLATVLKFPSPY